jgi:putative flippase GtrA
MKNLKKFVHKLLSYKFIRYSIGGWLGALIDLWCLYLFTDIVGIHYLISSVLAFVISVSFGFFFQKYFTFQDYQKETWIQLIRFAVFQGCGKVIDIILLWLLVEKFWWWYLAVSVFNKVLIFIRNFVMNQFFNFSSSHKWKLSQS